ncbi:MAG: copper amine oxidase N-terminal domain-containing protein [Tissierellia bacterium]|nr:copper amine oxidase N-terminal domain-containing protein [Tissierellia bacterium]
MFKAARFKKVLVISMVLVLTLGTIAVAANEVYQKQLTATFGRIKFKVDGKDVTKEIEDMYDAPAFVVDGRSYVPVRAIAELMGLEVKWDGETHTAEIIDVKSKAYEEAIKKKDQEIAELKKEIEKLKGKEKEKETKETDLKALEKKLNNKYGTYKNVYFDITLKESKNRIDVEILMDLKNSSQRNYWGKMTYKDRKSMIEDIVDTILSEFKDIAVYGSIYDLYYKRNFLTFSKPRVGKLTISHSDRYWGIYDDDIYDIVYDEFEYEGIMDAYVDIRDSSSNTIYIKVDIPSRYEDRWLNLTHSDKRRLLDYISYEIFRYYDYDRVLIDVYVDYDDSLWEYTINYKQNTGELIRIY